MAISQDEKHFSAWSNKVILLDELHRLEEAKIAAERAKLIFPENADFYFHLGNILGKQSHFEKAEKHYHQAIHILDQLPLSKNVKTQICSSNPILLKQNHLISATSFNETTKFNLNF